MNVPGASADSEPGDGPGGSFNEADGGAGLPCSMRATEKYVVSRV